MYLAKVCRNIPTPKSNAATDLARFPHDPATLRIPPFNRPTQAFRLRLDSTHVPQLEDPTSLLVGRSVGGARRLVRAQCVPHLGWEPVIDARTVGGVCQVGGQRTGEDQARDAARLAQGVFEREHAAPGMAKEMDAVEPERVTHRREFVYEEADAPERRIIQPLGIATPELVVQDDRAPGLRQRLQRLKVIVWHPGTAVQYEQRDRSRRRAGEVADDAVPRPETTERNDAFAGPYRAGHDDAPIPYAPGRSPVNPRRTVSARRRAGAVPAPRPVR